jgi:hypothetical protein
MYDFFFLSFFCLSSSVSSPFSVPFRPFASSSWLSVSVYHYEATLGGKKKNCFEANGARGGRRSKKKKIVHTALMPFHCKCTIEAKPSEKQKKN